MNTKYKLAAGLSLGVAIASSVAIAQLPKPGVPTPTPTLTPPAVVSVGAGLRCGETAKVTVVISGGSLGSTGRVTVTVNGKPAGSSAYSVAAKTQGTAVVNTTFGNCFQTANLGVKVEGTKLNTSKMLEPGLITFREWAGPI